MHEPASAIGLGIRCGGGSRSTWVTPWPPFGWLAGLHNLSVQLDATASATFYNVKAEEIIKIKVQVG